MTLIIDSGFLWNESVWNPSMISTALWLDANDSSTITQSSGSVDQWRDKSGNGRHATGSSTARPTYSATGFNSNPTIQFDGINDELILVPFSQVSDQNIFAVLDTTNLGSGNRIFMTRTPGEGSIGAPYLGASGADYRPSYFWGSFRSIWGSAVQSKAIIQWHFATGASASTRVNGGTAVTSTFAASVFGTWYGICFGGAQQADIDVSEIVITTSTLSSLDRQKVEGYLAHKWGLTANLPGDHPYKTAAPIP